MTAGAQSPPRRVLGEVVGLYWESGLGDDVPALSWYLLASLVPLALGLTALAAVVLGDYSQAQALSEKIAHVLPKDVKDQVVDLILRTKRDSPLLIVGSIAGMLWTCSGAVGVLARCLSRLLGIPGTGIVLGKLRNLGIAAALTILIVLMVVVASAGTGLVHRLEVDYVLIRLVVPLITLSVTLLICAGVYLSLAVGNLSFRAALAGGAVGGLILQLTPTAAGYYLRLVSGHTPVELFLMLAGVLFTCYLAALGFLLGAGVTARIQLGRRLGAPAATDSDRVT
ncbi:MAG: YihY/virulence factor BrkB family protein [Solirubrobacterales bacterium]|nr:YihY/virulence factor BrkB family protein [Solirubrobacterales bacterium]